MSQLLTSYESEFHSLLETTKLSLSNPAQANPNQLTQNKDELSELLEQMEIEVNNTLRPQGNQEETAKWRSHLRELKRVVQRDVEAPLAKLQEDRQRDLLFGGASSADDFTVDDNGQPLDEEQRQQLLNSHHILNKTNTRLQDAQRMATDTEQMGSQIMSDLRSQRETLEHSRMHLSQADTYLDKSVRTLRTMSRRLVANRFISYAIIAVLILLILLVLYSKFH